MARLSIIILDRPEPLNPNVYRYALWADVPVARQPFYAALAGPTAISAWKDALAADNTALQNGSVVEKVDTIQVPPAANLAEIRVFLQGRWTDFQALITANNPWQRYGTTATFNGTTWAWSPGGVS